MRTVYHLGVPRFRCCPRLALAALLLLSLLAGVFEAHEASERLGHERWYAGSAAESCHPDLPAHFEPTRDPEPKCPACLLRLLGRGASFGEADQGSELSLLGLASLSSAQSVSEIELPLSISRGPPVA